LIGFLAEKITDFFIKNNIIGVDDRPIYKYGSEIILSTMLGVILILIIGVLTKNITESVMFLLCFVSIRVFSGGYHANTYLKCNLIFIGVFILILILKNIVPNNIKIYIAVSLLAISGFVVALFSPVENKNKPLGNDEKIKNQKKSIFLSIIWTVIAIILLIFNIKLYIIIPITMFAIAISMIVEKIKILSK